MYEDGKTHLLVIEWEADGEGGAYEFGEAVAPDELRGAILGAEEEARDLLDANGSGWVSVLVGVGECVDDVDSENAVKAITFEA